MGLVGWIQKYLEFELAEQNKFIGFMAYEFYFSRTDYKAEIAEFFKKVNNGIKSKSETKTQILTEMEKSVTKETERIINE